MSGRVSAAPDDSLFKQLTNTYAHNHGTLCRGNICKGDHFREGITNGAQWYDVPGGMEDFNYLHSDCYEISCFLELSCCKYPMGSALPKEWRNNKESRMKYMEATHIGVKGRGSSRMRRATPSIIPGTYTITMSAIDYEPENAENIVVTDSGAAIVQDLKDGCGTGFEDGITNSAMWYSVSGGMQDWNWVTPPRHLTQEVSTTSSPILSTVLQIIR